MNTFKFLRCSKNDVRVRSMFDKMVFDPSLLVRSISKKLGLMKGNTNQKQDLLGIPLSRAVACNAFSIPPPPLTALIIIDGCIC